MVVILFRSRLAPGASDEHNEMATELVQRAKEMPGFSDFKTYRGNDGESLLVVHWETMETLQAWSRDTQHVIAKQLAKEKWYEYFDVEIADVTRTYHFDRPAQS